MDSDVLGLVLASTALFAAFCVVLVLRIPPALKVVLCVALALRIGGAVARYLVLTVGYHGVGDAMGYYRIGLRWAERYWQGDFSPLYDPERWRHGRWWGTQFVPFPASFVTAVIGPNLLGSFIVFSMFAFAGLMGFVSAYRNARPWASVTPYAAFLLLFPSLWFWPSSLGKESLGLLGLGLTVMGLFGRNGKIRIVPLLAGLFIVASVRAELAGILAVSVLVSQWLSFETRWSAAGVLRGLAVAAMTLLVLRVASERVGIASFDVEGIATFIEEDPARRLGGGSQIEAVSVGVEGLVLAPVNVLFRPFPWEAQTGLQVLSSIELVAFWAVVFFRRRQVWGALRVWRRDPLLRLSLVFIAIYAIGLGMMVTNLGLIARQRIFIFPFLMVALQSIPAQAKVVATSRMRQRGVTLRRPIGAQPLA